MSGRRGEERRRRRKKKTGKEQRQKEKTGRAVNRRGHTDARASGERAFTTVKSTTAFFRLFSLFSSEKKQKI
jgi:hypothetical protein